MTNSERAKKAGSLQAPLNELIEEFGPDQESDLRRRIGSLLDVLGGPEFTAKMGASRAARQLVEDQKKARVAAEKTEEKRHKAQGEARLQGLIR